VTETESALLQRCGTIDLVAIGDLDSLIFGATRELNDWNKSNHVVVYEDVLEKTVLDRDRLV